MRKCFPNSLFTLSVRFPCGCRIDVNTGCMPVSYTHLDVYKRQGHWLSVDKRVNNVKSFNLQVKSTED